MAESPPACPSVDGSHVRKKGGGGGGRGTNKSQRGGRGTKPGSGSRGLPSESQFDEMSIESDTGGSPQKATKKSVVIAEPPPERNVLLRLPREMAATVISRLNNPAIDLSLNIHLVPCDNGREWSISIDDKPPVPLHLVDMPCPIELFKSDQKGLRLTNSATLTQALIADIHPTSPSDPVDDFVWDRKTYKASSGLTPFSANYRKRRLREKSPFPLTDVILAEHHLLSIINQHPQDIYIEEWITGHAKQQHLADLSSAQNIIDLPASTFLEAASDASDLSDQLMGITPGEKSQILPPHAVFGLDPTYEAAPWGGGGGPGKAAPLGGGGQTKRKPPQQRQPRQPKLLAGKRLPPPATTPWPSSGHLSFPPAPPSEATSSMPPPIGTLDPLAPPPPPPFAPLYSNPAAAAGQRHKDKGGDEHRKKHKKKKKKSGKKDKAGGGEDARRRRGSDNPATAMADAPPPSFPPPPPPAMPPA